MAENAGRSLYKVPPGTGVPGQDPQPPGKKKGPGGLNSGDKPSLPPASTTKKKGVPSERTTFLAFAKAHPTIWKIRDAIWHASGLGYGQMTATEIAAVILAESGGTLPANGAGYGQIMDSVAAAANAKGVPFFRRDHHISQADKENPAFVAQYIAWRIGGWKEQYGVGLDDAWRDGYGGDQPGNFVSKFLPKNYPGLSGTTIAGSGDTSVVSGQYVDGLTNPWIVGINQKTGKVKTVYASTPPANALKYDGAPMQLSAWQSLKRSLDTFFVSYTGGRPDDKHVWEYVKRGWGTYALTKALAGGAKFKNSPIYKRSVAAFSDAAKDVLPPGQAVPKNLIKTAVVNGWDSSQVVAVLRRQPGYVKSNEFIQNSTTLMNVHTSIMGNPDQKDRAGVEQATLAGWKPDQYAAYLRGTDAYVQSPEYQMKTMSFLSALGLITGTRPGMVKGMVNPKENPNLPSGPLPYDPRRPKAGPELPAEDTHWTL